MKITIKELARRAGVSITTVSRAFNGYRDISPETRRRILQLAEELNYRPSGVARSLVMKKSKTLGLIISGFTNSRKGHHFAFDVICGVSDQASHLGYDMILAATSPHQQEQVPYIELCQRRQLDGVIFLGARINDVYLKEVLDSSVPCVLIDVPLLSDKCSHITVDNQKGARMAVNYLIEQGHEKIGFINGHQAAFVSAERLIGYEKAMKRIGTFSPDLVYHGNFDEESGMDGVRTLLQKHPDITAFFCASDWMAIGAIRQLKKMGKRVPEDVSVIGFDDIDMTQYTSPTISTVYQPRYEFGKQAVDLLVKLFEKEKGEAVVLEPQLVIRESTGSRRN